MKHVFTYFLLQFNGVTRKSDCFYTICINVIQYKDMDCQCALEK